MAYPRSQVFPSSNFLLPFCFLISRIFMLLAKCAFHPFQLEVCDRGYGLSQHTFNDSTCREFWLLLTRMFCTYQLVPQCRSTFLNLTGFLFKEFCVLRRGPILSTDLSFAHPSFSSFCFTNFWSLLLAACTLRMATYP